MNRHLHHVLVIIFYSISLIASAQSEISISILKDKAKSYFDEGNYNKAIFLVESAIDIYTDTEKKQDSFYGSLLSDLALYTYYGADINQAIAIEEQALHLKLHSTPDDVKNLATSYNHLCAFYGDAENFEKALAYGQESLQLLRKEENYGEQYIEALSTIGYTYIDMGRLDEARVALDEALALIVASDVEKSFLGAEVYTDMGFLYSRYGLFEKALAFAQKGSNLFKLVLGEDHPEYSYALHTLGLIYLDIGDYPSAEDAMIKCVDIRRKAHGVLHKFHIRSLINLGNIYSYMGNYDQSLRIYEQALSLVELAEGFDSSNYPYVLSCLAECFAEKGDFEKAIEIQSRVVALERSIHGRSDSDYTRYLLYLSDFYRKNHDYLKAIELAKEAISLLPEDLTPYEYYLVMANCFYEMNNFQPAIEYIDIAINKLNDKNGVSYLSFLKKKIEICHKSKSLSLSDLIEYDDLLRDYLIRNYANMSLKQRTQFWETCSDWFSKEFPQLVCESSNDSLAIRLYNDVLLTKGIILNSTIEFNKQIFEANSPELKKVYEDFSDISQQITSLLKLPIIDRYVSVDSLIKRRDVLEKQLISGSQYFGNYMRNLEIDWFKIKDCLRKDDLAIEFIDFAMPNGEQVYYALIVSSDSSSPKIKKLCIASEIDKVETADINSLSTLYQLIWGPIEEELSNAKYIYFSPTGLLYNIPIEYLSQKVGGESLMDKYQLYRLSSTRQIVLRRTNNDSLDPIVDIYAFGGIEYDLDTRNSRKDTTSNRNGFDYLPATKEEVEIIKSKMNKNYSVTTFVGKAATETAFKNLSGKNIYCLHVATHGFYWTDADIKRKHIDYSFVHTESDSQLSEEELILSHSGLLFAGANNSLRSGSYETINDDGILTSNEISNLDLSNVQLLVLSACKTGLGDVNRNEVYGLQRGFKAAGVQTIIMSMWEVDDNATSLLMTKFYENLFKTGSPVKSLKEAQQYVKSFKGRIKIKGEMVHVDYSHPKYWAAFIVLDGIENIASRS